MSNATSQKLRAYRFGVLAEYMVAAMLLLKGYRILGLRTRTCVGEIDILARSRSALIIVEVKARKAHESALYSIRPAQQERLQRAAQYILAGNPQFANLAIRFDCCTVSWYMRIHHMKNAF